MPESDKGFPPRPDREADIRPYIPMAILTLAFLVGILQQTFFALGVRSDLIASRAQQQATYAQALNFRNQLESLAEDTAKLATDGDPAAQAIEQALQRDGIDFPPPRP